MRAKDAIRLELLRKRADEIRRDVGLQHPISCIRIGSAEELEGYGKAAYDSDTDEIVVLDTLFDLPELDQEAVLAHELAHATGLDRQHMDLQAAELAAWKRSGEHLMNAYGEDAIDRLTPEYRDKVQLGLASCS